MYFVFKLTTPASIFGWAWATYKRIHKSSLNYYLNMTNMEKKQIHINVWIRFGLWCLKLLSTIFQLYRGGQCSWWSPPEGSGENYRPVSSHVNFLPKLLFVNLLSCIYKPFNKIAFMFKRKTKVWFDLFCNVIFLWQNIASQWQTVSHNVVSSTLHPNGIRFHNVSNNMRRLHR